MADVNTQIYQPLQASQQQQMTPLGVLQMIGQLNQNKLFNQEFQARQNIGQAWQNSVGPDGTVNYPQAQTEIAKTGGFRAGEALGQATQNSDADLKLRSGWQQTLRGIYGQFATLPNITDDHLAQAKVDAAGAGIPPAAIQQFVSTMPRKSNKKALKIGPRLNPLTQ